MTADESPSPIDLAHEADFALAAIAVRPSTRELISVGRSEVIEPRVMQVLVALADRRGRVVSRDDLIARCWGGRAVSEDAINRAVQVIRRLAEAHGGFSITTVPRVGYRLDEADPPLAGAAVQGLVAQAASRSAADAVLAVLAFDNLSADAELLYFSDGVSEEILQTVAHTTGLKVIGRSSSFQFRGAQKAARQVAAETGCTHVLDGAVRRSGDRVRISASLIECASQTTVWTDRFDRDLSDVFALQDEIAAAIAEALKSTFAPTPGVGPVNPAAYDLYLRARSSTPGNLGSFDADLLRRATGLDPGFAQAWSALAITRALQAIHAPDPARAEAREAAEKALALDPGSGSAYAALALLEPVCGRFEEAEALFQKALALSPDDTDVLEKYSRWLHGVGRSNDAFVRIAHAYDIDPLYHQGANWYAVLLTFKGRVAEAFEVWDKARARWPDFDILTLNAISSARLIKDWDRVDALVAWAAAHGVSSDKLADSIEAARHARDPTPDSKVQLLKQLRAQVAQTGTVSLNGLTVAWTRGLADEAFDLAGRASFEHLFQPGGHLLPMDYGLHVLFNVDNGLRQDARFIGLCAKLGLCDYWVRTGRWPDCAEEGALTYDFKAECRRLAAA